MLSRIEWVEKKKIILYNINLLDYNCYTDFIF